MSTKQHKSSATIPHVVICLSGFTRLKGHLPPLHIPHTLKPYIDSREPIWDIYRHIGGIMFYIGLILLVYDYFILNGDNPYFYGQLQNLPLFLANSARFSQTKLGDMNEAWLFFLYIGGGLDILGGFFTTKPKKQGRIGLWIKSWRKINHEK